MDPVEADLNVRGFENGFENSLKREPHLLGAGSISVKEIMVGDQLG